MHRCRARDAGGEIAGGGRIDQRVVPLGIGGEIRVSQKRRSGPAHRQQQRGRQIVIRQRLAVGIGDAELRPFRTRQLNREVGLVPRKVRCRGHAHFLQPGLAAPPFQPRRDVVRGRADHVGRAVQEIAAAVAVVIDGIGEIMRRQELRLSQFAGPGADHFVRRQVATVDDLQRGDGFARETFGAAAVIGQRNQRTQRRQVAHVGAEIAFQSPERGDDGRRHAVLLLGAGKGSRMRLDRGLALLHPIDCGHAPGELGEHLPEYALAAVAVDDSLVVNEVG